jgi:hypothetical protein
MADRIYVPDRGVITEGGTHEELMRLGGTYARLFELQAIHFLGGLPEGAIEGLEHAERPLPALAAQQPVGGPRLSPPLS